MNYITAAKAQGAQDSFLVEMLERNGWPRKDIFTAFNQVYSQSTGLEAPRRVSGFGDSARDAFLYLLSFGTLAIWTIALGSLCFTLIDIQFPDPVFQDRLTNTRNATSGSMAALLVAFPIYLFTMRVILRDLVAKPDKAESSVRRWLTYIALLLSAGTVIGDLVTFVRNFLRGELTMPFALKVAVVFIIAGGVFWYYLTPLEKDNLRKEGSDGP